MKKWMKTVIPFVCLFMFSLSAFAENVTYVEQESAPMPIGLKVVIALAVGFLIGFIVTGIWRSALTSVHQETRASKYIVDNSLKLRNTRELFLYKTLEKQEIPKQQPQDGRQQGPMGPQGPQGQNGMR